jgi:hypothetical protein
MTKPKTRAAKVKTLVDPEDNGYGQIANDAAEVIIGMWDDLDAECCEVSQEEQDDDAGEDMRRSNVAVVISGAIDEATEAMRRAWGMLSLQQKQVALDAAEEVWPGTRDAVMAMMTDVPRKDNSK